MSGTRSHRPALDDASAQSDLICAPQPVIIDQTQATQIGGYARASDSGVFTLCDVEMYAIAACGLTVAQSSAVRAS